MINTEKRQFKISNHMIFHTIENQAGSIEKALLECLMNAVDAGATKVSVDFNDDGLHYIVSDNGRGFASKEEIEKCFEVFGFDHGDSDSNYREYGEFGIGRAQLWAFSSNVWRTNNFILDVDVQNKGLDYNLSESYDTFSGCEISGQFYQRQTQTELQFIIRELAKLALYLPIEFKIDGKKINKENEKWTHDSEHAFIKFKESGDLHIYNKGVFVCAYPNYKFGKGGVILSKESLKLNTARNDILLSKCLVWKKIKHYVEEKSTTENLAKKTLTPEQRKNIVTKWVYGELNYHAFSTKRIFPDVKGRFSSFNMISNHSSIRGTVPHQKVTQITIAKVGEYNIGENIHNNKTAFVFSADILDWFNVENEKELELLINDLLERDNIFYLKVASIDFNSLKDSVSTLHEIVETKKYTKKQKAGMAVVSKMVESLPMIINPILGNGHRDESYIGIRKSLLGKSETSNAWTDSKSYIAIDAKFLEGISFGMGGMSKIVNVLIHEYLHTEESTVDHIHSPEFYENFHNILTESHEIYYLLKKCMQTYLSQMKKHSLVIPRQFSRDERFELDNEEKVIKLQA
jgi:hypothetical protein